MAAKKKAAKKKAAAKPNGSGGKKDVKYDEKAIQTLDALEHIRLRTGMYIGRLGDGTNPVDGIYVMMKEVIDNSIDEFIMGEGKKIEISRDDKTVEVRDYGRGIPLGKVVECVSQINTGGKYNDDVFQFSVGLNGVGTKAVNALSSDFEVRSVRDGKFKQANFVRGKLLKEKGGKSSEPNGTYIRFTPDEEIGTPSTRELIEATAAQNRFVLVPEPARSDGGGALVVSAFPRPASPLG